MTPPDERQQTLFELPPPMPRIAAPPKRHTQSTRIGRVLAQRRIRANIAQGELAARVSLSQDTLSRVELGKFRRGIPIDYIDRIARELGSSVTAVLREAAAAATEER